MARTSGQKLLILLMLGISCVCGAASQTRKPLTNADIVTMTKEGLNADLIVQAIQSSATDFDVSAQALVELKSDGVAQNVLSAMLSAQADKPSGNAGGIRNPVVDSSKPTGCDPTGRCLLKESIEVALKFIADLSSKTANNGDPVELSLGEDLKIGDALVVPKGSHAVATVSNAKRAGMLGKPGELSIQLQYLVAGDNHIRIRGTKAREGESKTGTTVALTVLFGPIGLIKHGKNVEIPAGTPLTAYVDQDIWLPPLTESPTRN